MDTMLLFKQLVPIIIMTTILYFVFVVPQNKRRKEAQNMMENLKVNDEVITNGGIMGKIINLQGDYVILQTGPDKVRLKINKAAILDILNKTEEVKKEVAADEDKTKQ